jgi:hypothetical protein
MKLAKYLFVATVFFSLTNCSAQIDPVSVNEPLTGKYEGCCGAESVEFTKDDAYMYVPNVFTPNGDGANDWFVPSINEYILGFDSYLIFTAEDSIIFSKTGFNYDHVENYAWDGNTPDGKPYIGPFKYEFWVFVKGGGIQVIKGKACRIECGPDAAAFKGQEGCFYPSQVGANGRLDKGVPNKEVACFE